MDHFNPKKIKKTKIDIEINTNSTDLADSVTPAGSSNYVIRSRHTSSTLANSDYLFKRTENGFKLNQNHLRFFYCNFITKIRSRVHNFIVVKD